MDGRATLIVNRQTILALRIRFLVFVIPNYRENSFQIPPTLLC